MAGLANPAEWMFDSFGDVRSSSGESVSVDGSLRIADVFAAVNLIAEAIGLLPLKVYHDLRLSLLPGEGVIEAADHRAYRMLHDAPNPYTPAHRFWSTVTTHLLLWGNAFIEKLRDDKGLVAELRVLHPGGVSVFWNELTGAKSFTVTRQSGMREPGLGDDRVLHIFGVSMNGLVGLSPIEQSREALGVVKARERFEGQAYGDHPYASGVIRHPAKVKDHKRIRESWRAIYGAGSKDRGGVAVLEEGAEFQELSAPMRDMEFVDSAKLSKTQIANIFKLPPSYIGGSVGDSLTYQTVESNKIWLATQALAPVANNIAQFLSHDPGLFPFPSWFCEFNMEGLLRGDSVTRGDFYEKLFTIKDGEGRRALTVQEIRDRENLGPATKEKSAIPPALATVDPVTGLPTSVPNGNISGGNG